MKSCLQALFRRVGWILGGFALLCCNPCIVDGAEALPVASVEDVRREEGDSGGSEWAFTVRLDSPAAMPVELEWETVGGDATPEVDYVAASGVVLIPPGELEATLRVLVLGDLEPEPNEHFGVRLSVPATMVTRVSLARAMGWGILLNDDLRSGVVARMEIRVPESSTAGGEMEVEVLARDAAGELVTGYNGPVSLGMMSHGGGRGPALPTRVVISSVQVESIDGVGFQNVAGEPVNLSGWRISLYDRTRWPVPSAVVTPPEGTVLQPGEYIGVWEASAPTNLTGFRADVELEWGQDGVPAAFVDRPFAVLLQDARGRLVDFVSGGGADPGKIDIPISVRAEDWPGFPLAGMRSGYVFLRKGWASTGGASDWLHVPGRNLDTSVRRPVPFVDSAVTPVTPAVVSLAGGRWVGAVCGWNGAEPRIRMVASDDAGPQGVSVPVEIRDSRRLRILEFTASRPFAQPAWDFSFTMVVTNETDVVAEGVELLTRFDTKLKVDRSNLISVKSSRGQVPVMGSGGGVIPTEIRAALGDIEPGGAARVYLLYWNVRDLTPVEGIDLPFISLTELSREAGGQKSVVDRRHLNLSYAPAPAPHPAGLVAWWRFHGDGTDAMGRYPGVVDGVVDVPREDSFAFRFDGTARVMVAHDGGLLPGPGVPLTLSAWMRAQPGRKARMVIAESEGAGRERLAFTLRDGRPAVEWGSDHRIVAPAAGADLRDGLWHLVFWSVNIPQRSLSIHVDGSFPKLSVSGLDWEIGAIGPGTLHLGRGVEGDGFVGDLDEVSLYHSTRMNIRAETGANALGKAIAQLEATRIRTVDPLRSPPVIQGRPYTIFTLVTNRGPFVATNVNLAWPGDPSIQISSVRRDGVELTAVRDPDSHVDRFPLGRLDAGAGVRVEWTFLSTRTNSVGFLQYIMPEGGVRDAAVGVEQAIQFDPDTDGDGIPNGVESSRRLDPLDPSDSMKDADADGFSNLFEFEAGTHPLQASSFPTMNWIVRGDRSLWIQVPTLPDRDYELEYSDQLGLGTSWQSLLRREGTGGVIEFEVSAPPVHGDRFYRVRPRPTW